MNKILHNGWLRLWVVLAGIWFIGVWGKTLVSSDHNYYTEKLERSIGSTIGLTLDEQRIYWELSEFGNYDTDNIRDRVQFNIVDVKLDWLNRISNLEMEHQLMLVIDDLEAIDMPIMLYPIAPNSLISTEEAIVKISSLASSKGIDVTEHLSKLLVQHKSLSIYAAKEEKQLRGKFIAEWNRTAKQDIDRLGLIALASLLPPFALLFIVWISLKLIRWVQEGFKQQS